LQPRTQVLVVCAVTGRDRDRHRASLAPDEKQGHSLTDMQLDATTKKLLAAVANAICASSLAAALAVTLAVCGGVRSVIGISRMAVSDARM